MKNISHYFFTALAILTPQLYSNSQFNSVKLQTDEKPVAGGFDDSAGQREFLINRYTITGILDSTFNSNGSTTTTIGTFAQVNALAIQADGKIIAAGFAITTETVGALTRYNTDGTLDTATFGTSGITTTALNNGVTLNDIALQADGNIVAVGSTMINGKPTILLARYTTSGVLDGTFGTGGLVTTIIGDRSTAYGVTIEADGDIVIGATVDDTSFVIARYDSTGSLDGTFGTGGITQTNLGNPTQAYSIIMQSDGMFILAGRSSNTITLARYDTSGSLDGTFGTSGIVTTSIGTTSNARSVQLQTDSKPLVTGFNDDQIVKVRYTTTGVLDSSFGTSGVALVNLIGFAQGLSLAIQSNGFLVVSGVFSSTAILLRCDTTGELDPDFGNGGIVTFPQLPSLIGPTGPTGPRGATGAQGPTGERGATGAAGLGDNFLFAFDTTTQTIATALTFQNITFNTNGLLNGWTHTAGSADFTCNQTGIYYIQYDCGLDKTAASPLAVLRATLNGTEITGSRSSLELFRGGGDPQPISHGFITEVSATDIIRLQFTAENTPVDLIPVTLASGTSASISINIIRVQ